MTNIVQFLRCGLSNEVQSLRLFSRIIVTIHSSIIGVNLTSVVDTFTKVLARTGEKFVTLIHVTNKRSKFAIIEKNLVTSREKSGNQAGFRN
jgi:hypothetical protein